MTSSGENARREKPSTSAVALNAYSFNAISLPRRRREIVGEDRRVLPQAGQLGVGDGNVGELVKEGVDAILCELFLRVGQRLLVGRQVRRGFPALDDPLKILVVVAEIIAGIGV